LPRDIDPISNSYHCGPPLPAFAGVFMISLRFFAFGVKGRVTLFLTRT
jgi:hypothetical protein